MITITLEHLHVSLAQMQTVNLGSVVERTATDKDCQGKVFHVVSTFPMEVSHNESCQEFYFIQLTDVKNRIKALFCFYLHQKSMDSIENIQRSKDECLGEAKNRRKALFYDGDF